jgi:hypothetical protein
LGGYKVEQRRLLYRGQEYHFVSYEGRKENAARKLEAIADAWFLMSSGRRWEVMPHQVGEDATDVDRRLVAWLSHTLQ